MTRTTTILALLLIIALLFDSTAGAAVRDVVYVSKSGNDAHDGKSAQTAVASVARGLAIAAQGSSEVRVAVGTYEESIVIDRPVMVSGGWSDTFEPGKQTKLTPDDIAEAKRSADCSSRTCFVTRSDEQAVRINYLPQFTGAVTLSHLVILGPDRSAILASSSYALVVQQATTVNLNFVIVHAGQGGVGSAGSAGKANTSYCTAGGDGGQATFSHYALGRGSDTECSATDGKTGTDGQPGVQAGSGASQIKAGAGAKSRFSDCGSMSQRDTPRAGDGGGKGDDGTHGLPGVAATFHVGAFALTDVLKWSSPVPQSSAGAIGFAGAGGGGGAAGGSVPSGCWLLFEYIALGGPGGRGSHGGCPGEGGLGGGTGGGSFGLVINAATVNANNVAVLGGTGGDGGVGGDGGAGASPEPIQAGGGGSPVDTHVCTSSPGGAPGGAGGSGGKGGTGGGGTGGNGGPAFAIVTLKQGQSKPGQYLGTGVQKINSGAPGNGGAGGKDGSGIAAPPGATGWARDIIQVGIP